MFNLAEFKIVGRLTKDPELVTTSNNGTPYCKFCLVFPNPLGKSKGVKEEPTYLNFTAWNQQAKFLTDYCHKGDTIYVTGIISTRSWETPTGDKKTDVNFTVRDLQVVSYSKKNEDTKKQAHDGMEAYSSNAGMEDVSHDEGLPF